MKFSISAMTLSSLVAAVSSTAIVHEARSASTLVAGFATFFNVETGAPGACGTLAQNSDHVVALSSSRFSTSLCGQTVQITNVDSGAVVNATVNTICPPCNANSVDLSTGAFSVLASLSEGRIAVTWEVL